MNSWSTVNKRLLNFSSRYLQLEAKFAEFADVVSKQTNDPSFHVKGVSTSLHLEEHFFTVAFAGRTVRFEFSAPIGDSGTFKGLVRCFLLPRYPDKEPLELQSFTFTGQGQTELIEPEDNDTLNITYDTAGLYIVLHTINDALSCEERSYN